MRKSIRCMLAVMFLLLLIPAIALAQLQTGAGAPAELADQLTKVMKNGADGYALTTCNGIANALLLVRMANYTNLTFLQQVNGQWEWTNLASDFCLPPVSGFTFSVDDRQVLLTVPASAEHTAEERFLFVWENTDYRLRTYTLRNADGTGCELLLESGGVTLTATDPSRPDSPITTNVTKNTDTAYLFSPILSGREAENRGGHNPDSASFYTALYRAQQAAGFTPDNPTATIAMAPSVVDGLKLRAKADAGSKKLGTFYGGVTVQILKDPIGGSQGGQWCEVQIGDLTGYMKRSYLSFLAGDHALYNATGAPQGQTTADTAVYNAAQGGEKIASLPARTTVSILGLVEDRYYIPCDDGYGFVDKSHITVNP